MLNSELHPPDSKLGGEECMLQQDETSFHTSFGVENWFTANNIQVSKW